MIALPIATWGHGPVPVVFLHGFTGSRHSFDHLAPLFAEAITATCVDLPGHHGAPLPTRPGAEGFREAVDAVAALVPNGATVIGYSQGARIALALALAHPSLVGHLVLESVSPGLRQRSDRRQRRSVDDASAAAIEASGVAPFIARWERHALFEGLRRLPTEVQDQLRARRLSHDATGLAGALRCLGQGVQPDLWPSLPLLRTPTLLLAGALDQKYARLARRAAAELPLAWHALIPGAGHAPHLERPEPYAREVLAFLRASAPHQFSSPLEVHA